jgi:hypothetical protein
MTTKIDNQDPFKLVSSRTPPEGPPTGSSVVPWSLPSENLNVKPLTERSVNLKNESDPIVAALFKTALEVNLGNNSVVPIALRPEQQEKYQVVLDGAAEQLKSELTGYLAVTDRHEKWHQSQEHVTWFRYHPAKRSIEYQIHNEVTHYHISLKEFNVSSDFTQERLKRLTDAASKLEKALSEITGITIKHVAYHPGSVTLFQGPRPFDKSTTPALKSLAEKSFEQALEVVKQQLVRKEAATRIQENFRDLKRVLEGEKRGNANHAGTVQVLEGLIQELDAMDGFAIGVAASSELVPKDYEAALKLNEEIYKSVYEQLRPIEEAREPSFGENLSRHWNGWSDPEAQLAREQQRREAAKQYAADVLGLCLDHAMIPETTAALQAASQEIYLSLRLVEPTRSTGHALYTYLTTRDRVKIEAFLSERFASFGDSAGKVLAKIVCDKLFLPEVELEEFQEEALELMSEIDENSELP